jgi:cell division protein FtsQ
MVRRRPRMSLDQSLNRLGRRRHAGRAPLGRRGSGGSRSRRLTLPRSGRPRLRLLIAIVVLAGLLGGGYLLLRDSGLVRVEEVRVTGVSSSAEPRIDAALDAAARGMTTLHVREGALRRAVAGFPSVAGLRVQTHVPHGLTIEVVERRPVAVLVAGDQRLAVSGDGRLLRDVQDTIGLPTIGQGALPSGTHVTAARTRAALAVAAAAPQALRRRAERMSYAARGLTVELVDGPPLIFGDASQAAAKWLGAARVLADPTSAGATYLDLREPGRVSAGGLGPVTSEDADGDVEAPVPGASATPAPTAVPTATPYSQP